MKLLNHSLTSTVQNFNGCTVEVCKWVNNFFTYDYLPMLRLNMIKVCMAEIVMKQNIFNILRCESLHMFTVLLSTEVVFIIFALYRIKYTYHMPQENEYTVNLSRQQNCWSLRCSWSIACRCCSNYIFILDLTPGFNGLGKGNCKTRRETLTFGDLVRFILRDLTVCFIACLFQTVYISLIISRMDGWWQIAWMSWLIPSYRYNVMTSWYRNAFRTTVPLWGESSAMDSYPSKNSQY